MHAQLRVVGASVAVGILFLAACGGDDRRGNRPVATTTITAAAEDVVPDSQWSRGRIEIDFPDGLAFLSGRVFVKTDDGHVVRVDPSSHEIEADVRVDTTTDPDHYCQGIGTDGHTLWACSAAADGTTDLLRLDPESLETRATAKIDKVFDQLTLPVVGGKAWVLTGTGAVLTELDTSSNRTVAHPLGRPCLQAAATERTVYVTCLLSDEVVAVDASTGKVLHRAAVAGPVNVVADDEDVWVSGSDGIVRLSPDLERRTVYPGLTAGRDGDLLATPDALWVRQGPEFLTRVDRASGRVAARYAIDPVPSGGSLVAVGDEIWTTAYDDGLVLLVDADH